ncbi:MAG: sterol carrier family protein [Frankiaceae bacterium]
MPRARRYDDLVVRAALGAQWALLVPALEAAMAADPEAAVRLPGWDVARLGGHVTGTVRRLADGLSRLAPPRATVDLAAYWAAGAPEPDPPYDLAAAVAEVMPALAAAPAGRTIEVAAGAMRLTDHLVTRVVEAVVHGLDLPAPVEPDRTALRIAAQALADLLAAREPGRTVELRVPPHAAVQCVAGPVHTRGTPPNVVETEPVAWVELACGRLGWDGAVAAGQVSASGNRADLAPYLPLL